MTQLADLTPFDDRTLSLALARVSEAAAIASARLVGAGDEKAADQAAVDAMRTQLNKLDIAGVIVIGEGERDEALCSTSARKSATAKARAWTSRSTRWKARR